MARFAPLKGSMSVDKPLENQNHLLKYMFLFN